MMDLSKRNVVDGPGFDITTLKFGYVIKNGGRRFCQL